MLEKLKDITAMLNKMVEGGNKELTFVFEEGDNISCDISKFVLCLTETEKTEKNTYFGHPDMVTVCNDTAYAKSYTIYALDSKTKDIIKGFPIIVGEFLEYDDVAFHVFDNYSKIIIFKNCDVYTTVYAKPHI